MLNNKISIRRINLQFPTVYFDIINDSRIKGIHIISDLYNEELQLKEVTFLIIIRLIENAIIYLNKFDEQAANSSLEWAIQFWKSQREAFPTTNRSKCRACESKKECKQFAVNDF